MSRSPSATAPSVSHPPGRTGWCRALAAALAVAACAITAGAISPGASAAGPTSAAASTPTVAPTTPTTQVRPAVPGDSLATALTPTAAPSTTPSSTAGPGTAVRAGTAGPAVLALQQRLSDLGYWLGAPDGTFGPLTTQAVYALQGAAGIDRDGVVGPATRQALDAGTLPSATTTRGRVTEVDRARGLVLFVVDGEVRTVLHTSTGTFARYESPSGATEVADTPAGRFRVLWAVDGQDPSPLGSLDRPRYFEGTQGIALHGHPSVPAYNASHGCARISGAAITMVWAQDLMPIGSVVVVR